MDASDATSTRSERSISSAYVLGELRRASASFPGHSTVSLAKPARLELHLDVLYLDVHLFPIAEHW
jgi:hypothetical protein